MSTPGSMARSRGALYDDVLRILGDIDERKALDILALRPSLADVEEAAVWISGDGDVLGKSGRPLTAIAAQIIDIIAADEDEPPPMR